MANFQKLQLSLILRVAWQILQILHISAVICRILQISPGSANSKPKFHSKKLAKVCSQKILQSRTESLFFVGESPIFLREKSELIDEKLHRLNPVITPLFPESIITRLDPLFPESIITLLARLFPESRKSFNWM